MVLSEGDKNTCREISRLIIKEVLLEHISSCPHGKTIFASKMLLIGMCIGSGLTSGGIVFALIKIISGG